MNKCRYKDCKEPPLSLSEFCFRHIEDKPAYRQRLAEHIKNTGSIKGFFLRHLEFPGVAWHNIDAEEADLAGADLSYSDFTAANLKNVNLTGANLTHADLSSADLDDAHLLKCNLSGSKLWHTSLININLAEADLEGADFLNSTISDVKFWHVNLKDAKSLTAHNFIGRRPIYEKGALSASEAYRNLKQYFISNGRYDDASWASFKEKELQRRYLLQNKRIFLYIPSLLMALLCGYGEKPYRVIVSSLVVIFGYGFIYAALGILKTPPDCSLTEGLRLWDYLYFSIVTFTTLGYGDLTTKFVPFFQMLVGSEAFTGAFMMGLFVFTLSRRHSAR